MKKLSYFFAVLLVSSLITLFYFVFLTNEKPSADRASLSLQPYTANEQQELILAQEQEEGAISNGPLIAQMTATDAEAKVLNLQRANAGSNTASH